MLPPPNEDTRIAELQRRVDNLESALRAAFTTISGGKGLRVTAGSKLVIEHPDGRGLLLAGIYDVTHDFDLPDGSRQPMWLLYRADGTLAMGMYDPTPNPDSPGGYQQFLAMYDREQNIILSDDTYSGQGLARPYVPTVLHRARYADWVTTTSTSFETLFVGVLNKQHPNLLLQLQASNDTAGATGEVRVLVNDEPWGAAQATEFLIRTRTFGSSPVDGEHMGSLVVKVQARVASGTGGVRVEPVYLMGRQS